MTQIVKKVFKPIYLLTNDSVCGMGFRKMHDSEKLDEPEKLSVGEGQDSISRRDLQIC